MESESSEIWQREPELLRKASGRFRSDMGVNIPLFSMWQIVSNRFYPDTVRKDKMFIEVQPKEIGRVVLAIRHPGVKSLCLNDSPNVSDEQYNEMMAVIRKEFDRLLARK